MSGILKNQKKNIKDTVFNVGAIMVMNCVMQFVTYPFLQRHLGEERYGLALSLISMIAVTAGAAGAAMNNYRVLHDDTYARERNGNYLFLLFVATLLCAGGGIAYMAYLDILSPVYIALYAVLAFFTMLRYYSDTAYKHSLNFLRLFLYYLAIALGYLVGILVYRLTDLWFFAILCGEAAAVLYASFSTDLYRRPFHLTREIKGIGGSFTLLFIAYALENFSLNSDRLLLMVLLDGEAVSVSYVASIFGKVVALLTVPISSLLISYLARYRGRLSRRLWNLFIFAVLGGGVLAFFGCWVASLLFVPVMYPSMIEAVRPYFVPAILAQILFFVSTLLLLVLLKFKGESKQFLCNVIYIAVFLALAIPGAKLDGIDGFILASVIANALRLIIVVIWGYTPTKRSDAAEQERPIPLPPAGEQVRGEKTLSVIIPVYNGAAYLPVCLSCLVNSEYAPLEVIIVDDGSTDDSVGIARSWATEHPFIRVISKENEGAAMARLTGIRASSGEFLTFLDVDDRVIPSYYRLLMERQSVNDADIVCAGYTLDHGIDHTPIPSLLDEGQVLPMSGHDAARYINRRSAVFPFFWNKIYRRPLFDHLTWKNGRYIGEDYDIMMQLCKQEITFDIALTEGYLYLQTNQSVTRSGFEEKNRLSFDNYRSLYEDLVRRFPDMIADIDGYFAVEYMAMVIAMGRGRHYDTEICRFVKRFIRRKRKELLRSPHFPLKMKVSAVLLSVSAHLLNVAYRLFS